MNPFFAGAAVRAALEFEEAMLRTRALLGEEDAQAVLEEAQRRHRETLTRKSLAELIYDVAHKEVTKP